MLEWLKLNFLIPVNLSLYIGNTSSNLAIHIFPLSSPIKDLYQYPIYVYILKISLILFSILEKHSLFLSDVLTKFISILLFHIVRNIYHTIH